MQTFELVKVVDPKKGVMLIRAEDYDPKKHKVYVEEPKVDAQPLPSQVGEPEIDAAIKPVSAPAKQAQEPMPKTKSQVRREKFMFDRPVSKP